MAVKTDNKKPGTVTTVSGYLYIVHLIWLAVNDIDARYAGEILKGRIL